MERAVGVVLGEASVGLTVLGQLKKSPSIGMLPKKREEKAGIGYFNFFQVLNFGSNLCTSFGFFNPQLPIDKAFTFLSH